MKLRRGLLALSTIFALILPSIFVLLPTAASAQTTDAALQRGYRTGYSDGFMAGYRDMLDGQDKAFERHAEYGTADRAFSKDYGALEDYRDGYRQGFRAGYVTGFDKKEFQATVPADLTKKGVEPVLMPSTRPDPAPVPDVATQGPSTVTTTPTDTTQTAAPTGTSDNTTPVAASVDQPAAPASTFKDDGKVMMIPKDTEILLQLQEDMGTQTTRAGEKFTAKVIAPMELDGAIVEGHVEKVQLPGRIKGSAEMQLSFDRIVLNDTRWSNFNGTLTEVVAVKGDNIKRISNEGTAVGQSSVKGDVIKISAATGTGAGIGAITGGPVGLAIGAGVGAAFGIGSALVDRGKHIRLNKNQQLKVRSAYDTQIR